MGLTATDNGGGDFKRVPPGAHIGRCVSVIDLGTQTTNGQYGEKSTHRLRVVWELFGEDADGTPLTVTFEGKTMPMTISKNYTVSLHEKANLRKELAGWRGRDFTPEEAKAFDVSKLLGAYCMVNVTQSESNGKVYSNVAGLTPLPSALKHSKPAGVHPLTRFDLDDPDMTIFAGFYEKLQELIKDTPEWRRLQGVASTTSDAKAEEEQYDDVPF